jgi:Transposase DDE domain group 1
MSLQSARQIVLGFHADRPVVVEASAAQLSSDGGLLVVREFDERIGLTARFAAALVDTRDPSWTHSLLSMVRQRIYGLLADYEDQNDHDELRSDPVFKLIADRLPDGPDLASQPTLSRFENAVTIADLKRLREILAQQFLEGFEKPPVRITLDVDAFDDPTHGEQQLTFFHGYYGQYQYLPIAITCAETDQVALVGLRHGTSHPALGADDDLRFLVARIRERWPDVEIVVRGDSGYGVPAMYDVCEELGLTYSFGLGMNERLKQESQGLLDQALARYEAAGQKQRLFLTLPYQARSWPVARQVIVKCEAHAQGTNRRAIVTHRPGAALLPQAAYDEYTAGRGRKPQQGAQARVVRGPPERPPLHGQLLPAVPARRRAEPAGAVASRHDESPHAPVAGDQRAAAGRGAARTGAKAVLQSPPKARPARRRPAVHLAEPADQGGR